MAKISNNPPQLWPKAFYDTGGGSAPYVQANQLRTGVVSADLQFGANSGTVISGSQGTITVGGGSSQIIIGGGQITIGGSPIGSGNIIVPPNDYILLEDNFLGASYIQSPKWTNTYSATAGGIYLTDSPNSTDSSDSQGLITDGSLLIAANFTTSGINGPIISLDTNFDLQMYADSYGAAGFLGLFSAFTHGFNAAELSDGSITVISPSSIDPGVTIMSTGGLHIHTVSNSRYAKIKVTNVTGIKTIEIPNATGTMYLTTGTKPTSSSSSGVVGQIEFDTGFLYICIAANTWRRVAVSSF